MVQGPEAQSHGVLGLGGVGAWLLPAGPATGCANKLCSGFFPLGAMGGGGLLVLPGPLACQCLNLT